MLTGQHLAYPCICCMAALKRGRLCRRSNLLNWFQVKALATTAPYKGTTDQVLLSSSLEGLYLAAASLSSPMSPPFDTRSPDLTGIRLWPLLPVPQMMQERGDIILLPDVAAF